MSKIKIHTYSDFIVNKSKHVYKKAYKTYLSKTRMSNKAQWKINSRIGCPSSQVWLIGGTQSFSFW